MRMLLHKFDSSLTHSILTWPDWVQPFMLVATSIGQPLVTLTVAFAISAVGLMRANVPLVISGLTAAGTLGIGTLLKILLHRDRPITDYVLMMRYETFSFPSGHSLGSMVSFGLLAYLLWHFLPHPWGLVSAGILALLIFSVGISRIYLGAHYPSDVLAGWLLGSVALVIIIFVIQPKL